MSLSADGRSPDRDRYRDYWRENLKRWAGLYDVESADGHLENLRAGPLLASMYRYAITPIERRLLRTRLELCQSFVRRYVSAGQVVNDVGCGTGVLTTELLAQGAQVVAIDFLDEALAATRARVAALRPQDTERVTYICLDVRTASTPEADIAIAIGLAPYVQDLDAFFRNVVKSAHMSYCHFIDGEHWANRVRRLMPALNVRDLNYTTPSAIEALYRKNERTLLERDRLGSGFLDFTQRS